jgi:hypothetical protein
VSSFGFGGTNAHIVLEQAPTADAPEPDAVPPVATLVVSGKSTERMAEMATTLADWMVGTGAQVPLADVAHTLNHHRTHHPIFGTVCAADRAAAVAGRCSGRSAIAASIAAPNCGPMRSGQRCASAMRVSRITRIGDGGGASPQAAWCSVAPSA